METYTIGFIIKRVREINSITQNELADISETDTSWISKVENGHGKVSMEKVAQICRGLDIPLNDIMQIYNILHSSVQKDFASPLA